MKIENLDPQLEMMCNLLSELEIEYCIDSGTLLGLVREGALLERDRDIDIAILENQQNKLIKLKSRLRDQGYKCRILSVYGQKFKFKFWCASEKRSIDINIFRESQDNEKFICPQTFPIIKNENPLFFYGRKIIRVVFGIIKNIGSEFDLNDFPWRIGTCHLTWAIPKDHFSSFEHLSGQIYVPRKYKEYLTFRYGDWKTPNKNWNFRSDDMGLSQKFPSKFGCM